MSTTNVIMSTSYIIHEVPISNIQLASHIQNPQIRNNANNSALEKIKENSYSLSKLKGDPDTQCNQWKNPQNCKNTQITTSFDPFF